MSTPRRRSPSEVLKRGYSDEEIAAIYDRARLWLESGDLRRSESLLVGINEIAPDHAPAWLAMSYIHIMNRSYDSAIFCARQALRLDPNMTSAMVFLVVTLMTTGDVNSAGTYLGELREKIESGSNEDANLVRLVKMQLARFETR